MRSSEETQVKRLLLLVAIILAVTTVLSMLVGGFLGYQMGWDAAQSQRVSDVDDGETQLDETEVGISEEVGFSSRELPNVTFTGPEANPKEAGEIRWLRSLDEGVALAQVTGKPIFLQFQEVPG